ncbi:MAG: hypothetical protein IPL65_01890 [Lewinellaceae bacterium]|nr:hypothetical protein [Lewinellaceae bacterium]
MSRKLIDISIRNAVGSLNGFRISPLLSILCKQHGIMGTGNGLVYFLAFLVLAHLVAGFGYLLYKLNKPNKEHKD